MRGVVLLAIALAGCGSRAPTSQEVAACRLEAERIYPKAEGDKSYDVIGKGAEFTKACMLAKGYDYGGDAAHRRCFDLPDSASISNVSNPYCYHR